MELQPIAHIHTEFGEKFGIPRQAGLVAQTEGTVVFTPAYRDEAALRGLEQFSHIWLLWEFSRSVRERWSPTVRPPRLGGNARLGVFATRSPFRPNPIGLSCVRLKGLQKTQDRGTVLLVGGADLLDGTPIYDIKPYLPYADCVPEAVGGFAMERPAPLLQVTLPDRLPPEWSNKQREALLAVLAQDPRPRYQDDPARVYGMRFCGCDVRFSVAGDRLTVSEILPVNEP